MNTNTCEYTVHPYTNTYKHTHLYIQLPEAPYKDTIAFWVVSHEVTFQKVGRLFRTRVTQKVEITKRHNLRATVSPTSPPHSVSVSTWDAQELSSGLNIRTTLMEPP